MGNNGTFAIFAAVTQSSDRGGERGRAIGGQGPPVRVHNVLNSNDSGGGGGSGSAAAA